MNFLAHAYLARHSDSLVVGNFIGDFVKGNELHNYNPDIREGIVMHRKIDVFTDTHPVFKRSRRRISAKYRHYAGVIIDMYYDHFLAKNWNLYADTPLKEFTEELYSTIFKYKAILPPKASYMLPYMADSDWLYHYASIEGIDRSLTGLSKRTSFKSDMDKASEDLVANYSHFELDFSEFFPQLVLYTESF